MTMMDNNNDPLADLIARHKQVLNKQDETTQKMSSVSSIEDNDEYGEYDLEREMKREEEEIEARKLELAKQAEETAKAQKSIIMPPDEKDMSYHEEAIGFQAEKLSIVSLMVQKVVAKYHLMSGGIQEIPNPELNTLGKREVMGELIDIYQNTGEVITPQFENMILSNWIMPDGSIAINLIDDDGIVNYNSSSDNNDKIKENKNEANDIPPTINITVEKNNPVTVNVDKDLVAQMSKSNEVNIFVKEVSQEELMRTTTIVKNGEKSGIIKPYDSGINDVTLTLPLSGYRCVIRAINWFDFIKLSAPSSQNKSDTELKKWSVIYEHIKNPSIGNFKNFEDFLKKTKHTDRELLLWGLLVATADDTETLSVTCGNPDCKHNMKIEYQPRNILNLDEEKIPSWYKRSHKASVGEDAMKVWEEANSKLKRYKLPNTGIIVEIEEPSAYDFITKKLPLIQKLYNRYRPDDESMSELNPEDPSFAEYEYLAGHAMCISAMVITRVEDGETKEYRFTEWDDIETIVSKALDSHDSGILLKIIEKTRSKVSPVSFGLKDIKCPLCGRNEEYIPINNIANTLLFQVSRRLSNTQINLIEMD